MAHFQGTIQGQRGEVSKIGSIKSGLNVTCNGWTSGITVKASVIDGIDTFKVYKTSGSSKYESDVLVHTHMEPDVSTDT